MATQSRTQRSTSSLAHHQVGNMKGFRPHAGREPQEALQSWRKVASSFRDRFLLGADDLEVLLVYRGQIRKRMNDHDTRRQERRSLKTGDRASARAEGGFPALAEKSVFCASGDEPNPRHV